MEMILTGPDLVHGLHQLGVREGMALEVHCSLSMFGYLEGGADTVINTLIQEVGTDGTIVMPSFRLSPNLPLTDEDRRLGLTMKIRILPENEDHTAMGIVSDTFRKRSDVVTGNGIFRVSAWGKDSDIHSAASSTLLTMMGTHCLSALIFIGFRTLQNGSDKSLSIHSTCP
jgi:Aminoglycoside N3''-acetyltransferase